MIEVKRILLSKLRNLEIPQLFEKVLDILQNQNLEAMHLQDIFNILEKQREDANTLQTPYRKHRLTAELARLHKKRLNYASLIHVQVKSLGNVDDDDIKRMSQIAKALPGEWLTYLGRKNIFEVSEAIGRFYYLLDTSNYDDARQAFVGLGLQHYLDELKKTNFEYTQLYNQRKKDIKERPRTGDPAIKRETLKVLQMLFDQVNFNQRLYKEVDYTHLIVMLNQELTRHSKSIKTRIATNKRRARKKAEAEAEKAAAAVVSESITVEEVVEVVSVSADEAQSSSEAPSMTNNNGPTTSKDTSTPKPIITSTTHNGAKGKQIPTKNLMKKVKRTGKRRRR